MAVPKHLQDHPIGRVLGVTQADTPLTAARKAIDAMKLAGMSKREIAKAEAMYDAAVKRGVK